MIEFYFLSLFFNSECICNYSRIIDIHNFNDLIDTLPEEYHISIYKKIGWLNVININQLSTRYFDLDFSKPDHREIGDIIVNLVIRGKGVYKLKNEKFRRNYSMDFIPGKTDSDRYEILV